MYHCEMCHKNYTSDELEARNLLPICECGEDLLQGEYVRVKPVLMRRLK